MFQMSTFHCDVTPPLGHPLCAGWYPPAKAIGDPLAAHGLVLAGDGFAPIVLCALDWAELSNHDHRRWREELADAAGTQADRVAVQCTHAHDTPWPDRDAQDLLDAAGHPDVIMAGDWGERVRQQTAAAAADSMATSRPCSHIATGQARVEQIASNRRVMGDNGKVRAVRWTKTRDPEVRAAPEGVIDPMLKTIAFWDADTKLAVLHYYAVHPTSYDGAGVVTPEFVGLARNQRIGEDGGTPHIYFTGCGGNVTAGKYNDGDPANRPLFTERIHQAMTLSEENLARRPLTSAQWQVEPVCLPPREDMTEDSLRAGLAAIDVPAKHKSKTALMLTYLRRREMPIPIACLHLNEDVAILNLPGEAFIEYQLLAQEVRPDAFVAVASYGDLGPGYITLARSFYEGGYEPTDSFISGASEAIMQRAIEQVLHPAK